MIPNQLSKLNTSPGLHPVGFAGQATTSDENDRVWLRNGRVVSEATGCFFGEKGVYTSSYRRPYCQPEYTLTVHRAGIDLGLTSSYSRAG